MLIPVQSKILSSETALSSVKLKTESGGFRVLNPSIPVCRAAYHLGDIRNTVPLLGLTPIG